MIDQEKILGHREPYNGMGEAVGLLHLMQTSRDQEGKLNTDQGRNSPETKKQESRVKGQGQETVKMLRDIKRTR